MPAVVSAEGAANMTACVQWTACTLNASRQPLFSSVCVRCRLCLWQSLPIYVTTQGGGGGLCPALVGSINSKSSHHRLPLEVQPVPQVCTEASLCTHGLVDWGDVHCGAGMPYAGERRHQFAKCMGNPPPPPTYVRGGVWVGGRSDGGPPPPPPFMYKACRLPSTRRRLPSNCRR